MIRFFRFWNGRADTENEYRMVFGDVLSYLRDANDVRVSNEAYGFQSTLSVVESLPANSPCQLLYAVHRKPSGIP